ncbi:MAG: hypothetical protein LBS81_01965 [Endomicrobium sp.]|jgi:hypothetical protein|nr:hypothetical protein [Endomicrobium sp.]
MADFNEMLEFRDIVIKSAAVASSEKKETFDRYVNFFLERLVYVCAFFKNKIIVYPQLFSQMMINIIERYNLNIRWLPYNFIVAIY